jgi:HAE1 family hydrophobic/amphiphilic exporter-1
MSSKKDFNYRITEFFLNNTRLTILTVILFLLISTIALLSLKTTGFPSPKVNLAVISTIYPGASSEVVSRDITKPIEGAIKSISGIETYTSVSRNSSSTVSVTIESNADADSVQSKISTAIRSVKLPSGVDDPQIIVPTVGSPDFIISLAATDKEKLYHNWDQLRDSLNEIPETSSITPLADLKQRVLISLNLPAINNSGLTIEEIQRQISSIGETLPVIGNTTLDGESQTISTKLAGDDINTLKQLKIYTSANAARGTASSSIPLSDLAQVNLDYYFESNAISYVGIRTDGAEQVLPALVVTIRAAEGSDKNGYEEELLARASELSEISIVNKPWSVNKDKPVLMITNLASTDSTKEQVQEVVGGLIGSKLKTNSPWANLGWLLGGIQLVFLAMLIFVSWRAAIVSALAIPLSLLFSLVYIFFIGESLNTLVLFSLVLVLGLVVDPALVILESIQRQIDLGHRGKEAALLAVKDVGGGLFLAALTNIIVFAPFGVISGVLGQIFGYIPLTIIPATIGSYIVPLVILAWIGGSFLRPTKGKGQDEEKNLWGIAQGLINLNYRILHSRVWVRLLIIIIALATPFIVTGSLIGNGKIAFVQFASSQNSKYLAVSGTFLPTKNSTETQAIRRQIAEIIANNPYVKQVFPLSKALSMQVELLAAEERPGTLSVNIAKELEQKITTAFAPYFFDIRVSVQGNGPPASAFKISLAVKTDNLAVLEKSAKAVGETLAAACKKDNIIVIDTECPETNKLITRVDNGYDGKENKALDITIDRNELYNQQFVAPNGPLTGLLNQQVKRLFNIADDKKIASIKVDGEDTEVFLDKQSLDPGQAQDLGMALVKNSVGEAYNISAIAALVPNLPKDTIQGVKGQTVGVVQGRIRDQDNNESIAAQITQAVIKFYQDNDFAESEKLGLSSNSIEQYSEGSSAGFAKSFQELLLALVLAIVLSYFVLAIFFGSLGQPLVILFTVPLTFLGVFPALASFTTGEFGFLEIIGLIILVGIVENVAIFLIDAANQKIRDDQWEEKRAISFASGIRFRPVILTKITAIASLAPLALLSEFYRSISLVIIFGLITSGFTSLITTPILFIFFRWLSRSFQALQWWHKILFFPLFPIYIIAMGIATRKKG